LADQETADVAIVGGSLAGLQAALTLGRAVRSVAVIDDGRPRNAPARRLHNFLAAPDESPARFLDRARDGLAQYDVRLHQDRVKSARANRDGVDLTTASGRTWHARALLLATGLREELPPVPGVAELWGTDVVACPHCHGWEVRGEHLALIGLPAAAARTVQRAMLISRWTGRLALYANGTELTGQQRAALAAAGVEVRDDLVDRLDSEDGRLSAVVLANGTRAGHRTAFVVTRQWQQADLARQLGCEHDEKGGPADGTVRTDPEGRTSVDRVWATGSTTAPGLLGIGAAGHGSTVAVAIHNSLTNEELRL
jgi:thioredoxin reductase